MGLYISVGKTLTRAKASFVDGETTEERLACVSLRVHVHVCYLEAYACVFEGAHGCGGWRLMLDIYHCCSLLYLLSPLLTD